MRKALGDANKKARAAAVSVLVGLKGRSVKTLKEDELKALVASILQLLGLADENGNIK